MSEARKLAAILVADVVGCSRLAGAGVEHRAACRSYRLHHLEHRDPADRLLIAAAIELACPLDTYNERI